MFLLLCSVGVSCLEDLWGRLILRADMAVLYVGQQQLNNSDSPEKKKKRRKSNAGAEEPRSTRSRYARGTQSHGG